MNEKGAPAVEGFRLSPEQTKFTKDYGKINKLRQVLQNGIMFKMRELDQLQQMADGFDLKVQEYLNQAPTVLDQTVEQPPTENLVINY